MTDIQQPIEGDDPTGIVRFTDQAIAEQRAQNSSMPDAPNTSDRVFDAYDEKGRCAYLGIGKELLSTVGITYTQEGQLEGPADVTLSVEQLEGLVQISLTTMYRMIDGQPSGLK